MVRYLSKTIVNYIIKNDETADYDELIYGYETLLHEILVVLIIIIGAIPFGLLLEVSISLVTYHLLRNYAGGAHAKYQIVCTVTTFIFLYGTACLSSMTNFHIPIYIFIALYVLDTTLLLLYAPADTSEIPICKKKIRKLLKMKSILCLTSYFLIAILVSFRWTNIANIIVITPTITCCLTHPLAYWLYGCKKSNRQSEEKT